MENNGEFYIAQIETTKKIIKEFSAYKEFSPTMLLNSLLSLVVLPYEKAKKKNGDRIFSGKYEQISKNLGFSPDVFQPIKCCDGKEIKYNNKTIYAYINKLRNGIAHQNLSVNVNENKEVHISIYNQYSGVNCKKCKSKKCEAKGLKKGNGGVVDFQITVSIQQLQKIALYIADSYLILPANRTSE